MFRDIGRGERDQNEWVRVHGQKTANRPTSARALTKKEIRSAVLTTVHPICIQTATCWKPKPTQALCSSHIARRWDGQWITEMEYFSTNSTLYGSYAAASVAVAVSSTKALALIEKSSVYKSTALSVSRSPCTHIHTHFATIFKCIHGCACCCYCHFHLY